MRTMFVVVGLFIVLSQSSISWSQTTLNARQLYVLENLPRINNIKVSDCVLRSNNELGRRTYTIFYEITLQYGSRGVVPPKARISPFTFIEGGMYVQSGRNTHHDLQHHKTFDQTYIISYDFDIQHGSSYIGGFPRAFAITRLMSTQRIDPNGQPPHGLRWHPARLVSGDDAVKIVSLNSIKSACGIN